MIMMILMIMPSWQAPCSTSFRARIYANITRTGDRRWFNLTLGLSHIWRPQIFKIKMERDRWQGRDHQGDRHDRDLVWRCGYIHGICRGHDNFDQKAVIITSSVRNAGRLSFWSQHIAGLQPFWKHLFSSHWFCIPTIQQRQQQGNGHERGWRQKHTTTLDELIFSIVYQ